MSRRTNRWAAWGVACLLSSVPMGAQVSDDAVEATEQFNAWVETMGEAVSSVRFDESDVESFLKYWPEFESIGEDESEDGVDWEELRDLDFILDDARYRSWVASRGLDGRDWLLKSMRIVLMSMRDQMQAMAAMAEQGMSQQMAALEEQCAQMGEERCAQMKAGMEASAAMMAGAGEVWREVPEPTAQERALLERYGDELLSLLEGEDDADW